MVVENVAVETEAHQPLTFRRLIGTGIGAKLLVDIGQQIFNPFLPVIAAGLGISVVSLGRLVGLRSLMGIFAPLFGVAADRTSYRLVIRWALLLNAAGFLLLGLSQGMGMTVVAMILAGLGTSAFVPNLQAYVSGHLPYSIRARGLGMIEYSWALTGIVGLSLVGILIQLTNWRVPFFLLALGMVIMSFVFGAMPAVQGAHALPAPARRVRGGRQWRFSASSRMQCPPIRRSWRAASVTLPPCSCLLPTAPGCRSSTA